MIMPIPILINSARTGGTLSFAAILIVVPAIVFSLSAILGLADAHVDNYFSYRSRNPLFDTWAKRIFFTYAIGYLIGAFLFKKRGP